MSTSASDQTPAQRMADLTELVYRYGEELRNDECKWLIERCRKLMDGLHLASNEIVLLQAELDGTRAENAKLRAALEGDYV